MSFWSRLFRHGKAEMDKKAYEIGYKDGLKAGRRVGKKEGQQNGWKEAMSTIANIADEMIIKKD